MKKLFIFLGIFLAFILAAPTLSLAQHYPYRGYRYPYYGYGLGYGIGLWFGLGGIGFGVPYLYPYPYPYWYQTYSNYGSSDPNYSYYNNSTVTPMTSSNEPSYYKNGCTYYVNGQVIHYDECPK